MTDTFAIAILFVFMLIFAGLGRSSSKSKTIDMYAKTVASGSRDPKTYYLSLKQTRIISLLIFIVVVLTIFLILDGKSH